MATQEDVKSRLAAGNFDGPGAEWHYHQVPNGGGRYASVGVTYTNEGETEVLIHLTPGEGRDLAEAILALLRQEQA